MVHGACNTGQKCIDYKFHNSIISKKIQCMNIRSLQDIARNFDDDDDDDDDDDADGILVTLMISIRTGEIIEKVLCYLFKHHTYRWIV